MHLLSRTYTSQMLAQILALVLVTHAGCIRDYDDFAGATDVRTDQLADAGRSDKRGGDGTIEVFHPDVGLPDQGLPDLIAPQDAKGSEAKETDTDAGDLQDSVEAVDLLEVECGNGKCVEGLEDCEYCPEDCGCPEGDVCVDQECCSPQCDGKECGADGCDGICGVCDELSFCDDGACLPWCSNGECDNGEVCDTCPADCGDCPECLDDPDCAPFEDGDFCNGTLFCDKSDEPYSCATAPESVVYCPSASGPNTPCLDDLCETLSGMCSLVAVNDDGACYDVDTCTAGKCANGECILAGSSSCDDDDPCTGDSCMGAEGCNHWAKCVDGVECTIDSCNSETGECTYDADNGACDDTVECTTDICDPEVGCQNVPFDNFCNDGIECTKDSCDPELDCLFVPDDAFCDDQIDCTSESCSLEAGCTYNGDDDLCDDQIDCTMDSCELYVGCTNLTDDDLCDDEDPCTMDNCDAATGCENVLIPGCGVTPGFVKINAGSFWMGSPEGCPGPDGYDGDCTSEPGRDSDETLHYVKLTHDFEMQVHEVTQGEWKTAFAGWNPSFFPQCGDNCPVEQITWYDLCAFANWKSEQEGLNPCYVFAAVECENGEDVGPTYKGCQNGAKSGIASATVTLAEGAIKPYSCQGFRLPTEAEWEYAARAGSQTALYLSEGNNGVLTQTLCSPLDPNLHQIGWYGANSVPGYSSDYACSPFGLRR
jgi:hypothetical protein